jgi:hypothetical protein
MKVLFKLNSNKKVISISGFDEEIKSPENVYLEVTQEKLNEYGELVGRLFYENGKFITKDIDFKKEELKHERIVFLKDQLFKTDFKIIKCMEAKLLDKTMPYNYVDLIQQREAWRKELNDLEEGE